MSLKTIATTFGGLYKKRGNIFGLVVEINYFYAEKSNKIIFIVTQHLQLHDAIYIFYTTYLIFYKQNICR